MVRRGCNAVREGPGSKKRLYMSYFNQIINFKPFSGNLYRRLPAAFRREY
jgi:hypothetical protein